jgi:hypothetical protein
MSHLKWDVPVLAGGRILTFITQGFEGAGDPAAAFGWVDHIINVTAACGD